MRPYLILHLILFLDPVLSTFHNIWLIRHCDKPSDKTNPCCTNYGYDRANNWYNYFNQYIESEPYIYASNYNEKKQCTVSNYYISDSECQKSQRMFLTAQAISDSINYMKDDVNIDFCTGQYADLIDTTNTIKNNDIIIVWEHTEIVDMINYIGIDIEKWPDDANHEYNVVFMIDMNDQPTLYYDCYNWENRDTICSPVIDKWLKKHDRISYYYRKYGIESDHRYMLTTPSTITNDNCSALFINVFKVTSFVTIFGLFIFVLKKLIDFIKSKHPVSRKYKYVRISDETQLIDNLTQKHKYTQT